MAPRRQQEEGQANVHAGHWLHVVLGDTGVILWKACPRLRRPPEALCLGHTNMLTTQCLTFLQSKQTSQEEPDMLNRYLAQPITTRRKRKGRKEGRRRSIHRHYG
ncbi:unnamed protein product [Arctogadus glacialis]